MITDRVKALFNFIEFLHSNIKNFKKYDVLIIELQNLGNERSGLNQHSNYIDKNRYDEIQLEIKGKMNIINENILEKIKTKTTELDVCNYDKPDTLSSYNISEIRELKSNFCNVDIPIILEHKSKYIEYRNRTNTNYFNDFFFRELDELLNDLFDNFNVPHNKSTKELEKRKKEFINELDLPQVDKEIPYVELFKNDEYLRNKLFEDYLKTELKPNVSLYAKSHFTDEEWNEGWDKRNDNIPPTTRTNNLVMAGLHEETEFIKKVNDLHTRCIDLHLKNQLPREFYTHYISDTTIFESLKEVKQRIDGFNNNFDTDNPLEYAISFSQNLIDDLDSFGLPKLKKDILSEFVKPKNKSVIEYFVINNTKNISEVEALEKYEKLKSFADKYIKDNLKNDNSANESKSNNEREIVFKKTGTFSEINDALKERYGSEKQHYFFNYDFTQTHKDYETAFNDNENLINEFTLFANLKEFEMYKEVAINDNTDDPENSKWCFEYNNNNKRINWLEVEFECKKIIEFLNSKNKEKFTTKQLTNNEPQPIGNLKTKKLKKTLLEFINNIQKKEEFIQELKIMFPTEIGKDIRVIIDRLQEESILIIGAREYKHFVGVLAEYFKRNIGKYQGIQNKMNITKETSEPINVKLNPLIIKYKTT